jgi:hypothetical protein
MLIIHTSFVKRDSTSLEPPGLVSTRIATPLLWNINSVAMPEQGSIFLCCRDVLESALLTSKCHGVIRMLLSIPLAPFASAGNGCANCRLTANFPVLRQPQRVAVWESQGRAQSRSGKPRNAMVANIS